MAAPRVTVDGDVCMGTGSCVSLAPNTFEISDDNVAIVVNPAGDPLDDVLAAEDACPTEAITVDVGE